jgi:hypothetical protein
MDVKPHVLHAWQCSPCGDVCTVTGGPTLTVPARKTLAAAAAAAAAGETLEVVYVFLEDGVVYFVLIPAADLIFSVLF